MSYPDPALPVLMPTWYCGSGGAQQTFVGYSPGTIAITTPAANTFTWGDVAAEWIVSLTYTPLPPPTTPAPGGIWFGPALAWRGYRYRTDTDIWVIGGANAPANDKRIWWTDANAAGPTGAFRWQFPTYVNMTTGELTYTDSVNVYEIWASDVLPPGVDADNPVRFTAKPMSSAKGALRTVVDGGFL